MSNKKNVIGLATIFLFGAIFAIAYSGKGEVCFTFLRYIPGGDKTGHVFLLCLLSVALTWLSSFRSFLFIRVRIYYGVVATLTFITIEEFLQIVSPNRSFDLIDLACNYFGITLGCFAIMFLQKKTEPAVKGSVPRYVQDDH